MEKHGEWQSIEHEYLQALLTSHPEGTYQTYADRLTEKFGLLFTKDGVRNKLRRSQKNKISYFDKKNDDQNIEEFLQMVIESQKKLQQMDDRQTSITVDIDDDKPIGIAFTGDWHVGGLYTDHEAMKRDFAVLRDTDGLYNITMGDYNDNYITRSHAGGQFEQIIHPDKQKELCKYFFAEFLGESNLAVIKGNHDNWENKETGEDFVKYIARLINSPYLWYGGEIKLKLGEQTYQIHAHHAYKYNSSINTTNSQRNLFNHTHADVIALGHIHHNEKHEKTMGGKDTVWLRTGSYKLTDDYSQWIGGYKADNRVPMVIFWPDKKKFLGFRDLYDGVKYLEMLRNEGLS